jgi:DNA polymerase delta subunit 1
MQIPGVVQVDLLVYLRREMKLESYKLDDVAYALTRERKVDLPPKQLFAKLASGDAAQRAEVAAYCIQDCRLVADIVDTRDVLLGLFETADVSGVQCSDILSRGMQVRSYTQILREATPLGYLLPDMRRTEGADDQYEGATVLHAQPGIYYNAVAGLDFASLYPSIMIADNVCYATLLGDDVDDAVPHFAISDDDGNVLARFASDVVGVLPTLLRKLWAGRKETKKLMAAETDPMRKKLLNAKQLAQKVGMNSVYGLTGATRGMLPCVRIAAAITAQGRAMLKRSKEYVEAHFPCEVVYGDSVAADTLLTVLEPGAPPRTLRVDRLYDELEAMREDQTLSALCILTHAGVQPVLAAVRHETTKRMFRVTLANGASVDVTEDHSLISGAGDAIRPTDLVVGTTRIMVAASH